MLESSQTKPDGRGKWIRTPKKKICKDCGETDQSKMHSSFSSRAGKSYTQNLCRKCNNLRNAKWLSTHPEVMKRKYKRDCEKDKANRKSGKNPDKFLCEDSRSSDRKHGRKNDMTKEFIRDLISKGCSYCGETKIKMSIDRIDNSVGHVKTNVVPACIRCNYFRRSMPYEAWLVVAEGVRDTRLKGLFGDWTARARTCG